MTDENTSGRSGELQPLPGPCDVGDQSPMSHSGAAWAKAWARLTAVRVYLALSADPAIGRSERRSLLRALSWHLGTSEAHLRRLAAKYFYAQSIEMFLPRRTRTRLEARTSVTMKKTRMQEPCVLEIIETEVLAWHESGPGRLTKRAVFDRIAGRCLSEGLQPPSYATVAGRMRQRHRRPGGRAPA